MNNKSEVVRVSEELLSDARNYMNESTKLSVPIVELATLGSVVSSMIPALNTVTQTTTVGAQGLYRVANMGATDALKVAQNGTYWGSFKTAEGVSKFAQLTEAEPLSSTTVTQMPVSPAMMMMAVALYGVEKQLGNIADMQKEMCRDLEIEKESRIEADLETIVVIINKYKYGWDNEQFISSNHQTVCDIQRSARANMISFEKKVSAMIQKRNFINVQANVTEKQRQLEKQFKYYRLAVYTYSLSSMLEIMISGNFKEEYIVDVKSEIASISDKYRKLFTDSSLYLEKMSISAVDSNLLKGVGAVTRGAGKLVGAIPFVKEGQIDEILLESGEEIEQNAKKIERKSVGDFASNANPGIGIFVDQMENMIQIYNHTEQILFDEKEIYLIAE